MLLQFPFITSALLKLHSVQITRCVSFKTIINSKVVAPTFLQVLWSVVVLNEDVF